MGSLSDADGLIRETKRVRQIKDNVKRCTDHLALWRTLSKESFGYYGNDQWDEEDIGIMERMKKVPITFNRVTRTISAVMGIEASNRQGVMYYPREIGDSGVSELLTGAANWTRESCDAEDEESQAFKDTLICGLGCTETRLDYERDREGNVVIERRDPLEMGYDINARKDNLDDTKFRFRINRLTKEELKEMWPEKADSVLSDTILSHAQTPHDATKERAYKQNNGIDLTNDGRDYEVIQYQDYVTKPYWLAVDLNGQMVELDAYSKNDDSLYVKKPVRLTKRKYMQTFIIGDTLLEEHELPVEDFTFKFITGLYNRKRNYWFGLVELMKDPQMWANKWLTEILYILRTNASGGGLYESGSFVNPQKAIQDMPKPNTWVELTTGGAAKISPKPGMGGYPDGLMNILPFAVGGIQDVTGVNVEMLGLTDRTQPMGLEKQRKEAGTGILSPFFNALRRYHKEQGRVLAEFIIGYISDGRLVRISGEEGAKYVPLLKDNLTFKYDIIVDEAVTSPDIKQKVFELIAPMIPTLVEAGIPVPPELLDYSPIPSGLTAKWKELLAPKEPTLEEQQAQQQAEEEAKMKQELMEELMMEMMIAEKDYKNSQSNLNNAKVMSERMKAAKDGTEAMSTASGLYDQRRQEELLREQARQEIQAILQARMRNAAIYPRAA